MATPLFPATNNLDIPYQKTDGVINPDQTTVEPGCWFDSTINDVLTAHYPQAAQVSDYELTGTFASSALWTVTVTPLTTQSGTAAAAHAQAAASAQFQASADAAADVVTGLIAAVNASITTIAGAYSSTNIATYVVASVGASSGKLRLTARTPGATFSVSISSDLAGDSATETVITAVPTATAKVGLYYALDTSKGTNGYDAMGNPYITAVTSSTSAANIIGPVFRGPDTQPVAQGFAYREYKPGQNIPMVRYGHVTALAEAAIALSSGPEPVYVRHTTSGDSLAGMVADATQAAVGATANVWTGTPTVLSSTEYIFEIDFNDHVQQFTVLSDGTATATEICDLARTEINKFTAAGEVFYGLTTSGTATLIITGPDDGRAFTPSQVAASAGTIAWVETTAEVSTHTLLTRGDEFVAPCTRIGPAKVAVPVTPA